MLLIKNGPKCLYLSNVCQPRHGMNDEAWFRANGIYWHVCRMTTHLTTNYCTLCRVNVNTKMFASQHFPYSQFSPSVFHSAYVGWCNNSFQISEHYYCHATWLHTLRRIKYAFHTNVKCFFKHLALFIPLHQQIPFSCRVYIFTTFDEYVL